MVMLVSWFGIILLHLDSFFWGDGMMDFELLQWILREFFAHLPVNWILKESWLNNKAPSLSTNIILPKNDQRRIKSIWQMSK